MYFTEYKTPIIGVLTLASDGEGITGCWFDNDKYFGYGVDQEMKRKDDLPVFKLANSWLDRYFAGEGPNPRELPLTARATEFQMRVREAMLDIPYGQTTTYGAIAKKIEAQTGKRQSSRAVGGAVARNPLCLIVPCHRVVGSTGSLTGFGGGIEMKVKLLEHENAMEESFKLPKRGTALVGIPNASRKGRGAAFRFSDLSDEDMYAVVEARDASYAETFVVGIDSKNAYFRPGSGEEVPAKEDCRFFETAQEAEQAGFAAC